MSWVVFNILPQGIRQKRNQDDSRHHPQASACACNHVDAPTMHTHTRASTTHTPHTHINMEKAINKYKICLGAKFYDYGIRIKLYGSTN